MTPASEINGWVIGYHTPWSILISLILMINAMVITVAMAMLGWWMMQRYKLKHKVIKVKLDMLVDKKKVQLVKELMFSPKKPDLGPEGVQEEVLLSLENITSATTPYVDHFLDLDPNKVARISGCELVSFNDYLRALEIEGQDKQTTLEAMGVTLFQRVGPEFALPLMVLVPRAWRSTPMSSLFGFGSSNPNPPPTPSSGNGSLPQSQSSRVGGMLARDMTKGVLFSPVMAAFLTEFLSQLKRSKEIAKPLINMLYGEKSGLKPDLPLHLPNPFVVSRDLDVVVQSMLESWEDVKPENYDQRRLLRSKPIAPDLLPGLEIGYGGLFSVHTARQECRNRLFAVILNRLACNPLRVKPKVLFDYGFDYDNMPDATKKLLQDIQYTEPFVVQIDAKDPSSVCSSPREFIQKLIESNPETKFRLQLQTQSTSFGIGLCVRIPQDNEKELGDKPPRYAQIPLGCAMKCEISRPDGFGGGVGDHVVTLLCHSGLSLHVTNGIFPGHAQYYEGVEGFNGWMAENNPEKPWQIGDEMALVHERCSSREGVNVTEYVDHDTVSGYDSTRDATNQPFAYLLRTMQYCAAASTCSNLLSSFQRTPMGGYGTNGVCIDSVAIIQSALRPDFSTTLYPIVLYGPSRQEMFQVYDRMKRELCADGGEKYTHDAFIISRLQSVMHHLPVDITPSLSQYPDLCRRILLNIPLGAPFALLDVTKMQVEQLLRESSVMSSPVMSVKCFGEALEATGVGAEEQKS